MQQKATGHSSSRGTLQCPPGYACKRAQGQPGTNEICCTKEEEETEETATMAEVPTTIDGGTAVKPPKQRQKGGGGGKGGGHLARKKCKPNEHLVKGHCRLVLASN
jgi:hypothetical protein